MRRLVVVVALLLSPLLASCSDDPDAPSAAPAAAPDPAAVSETYAKTPVKKIFKQVRKAMGQVRTAHVTLRLSHDELGAVNANIRVDRRGSCVGTVRLTDRGSARIRRVGDRPFFKPDYLYWEREYKERADEMRARVGTKWIEGVNRQWVRVCDMDDLLAPYWSAPKSRGKVVRHGTRDGAPTVVIRTRAKGATYYFEVAATAPHRLLRMTYGEWVEFIDLTDFNKPISVTVPRTQDLYRDYLPTH